MNHGGGEWGVGSGRTRRETDSETLTSTPHPPLPTPLQYNPAMAEPHTKKKPMDRARFRAVLKDAGEIIWRSRLRLGTGLAQVFGGIVTAGFASFFLFHFSTRLASMVFLAFFAFAGILFWAFSTARPMFRKRGEVYGDVTGRLTEGFSGIRIVKAYTA